MHVLYLEQTIFDFYTSGTESVLRFDFSPVAANIEITNKDELTTQIKAFIDANKITPGNLSLVLSENILFAKNVPDGNGRDDDVKAFLDSVPFEHVATRTYPIQGGVLAVGTNRDFYQAFKDAFAKYGFSCDAVVPVFVAGVSSLNPQTGLDLASAKAIASSYEALKPHTIDQRVEVRSAPAAPRPAPTSPLSAPTQNGKPAKNTKRTYVLVGIFGVLIIVLIIMVIQSSSSNSAPKKPTLTPSPQALAPIAQKTSDTQVLGAETHLTETITIRYATKSAQNSLLQSKFQSLGYQTNGKTISIPPVKTTILFSSKLSAEDRKKITDTVADISPVYFTQDVPNLSSDAEVMLSEKGK